MQSAAVHERGDLIGEQQFSPRFTDRGHRAAMAMASGIDKLSSDLHLEPWFQVEVGAELVDAGGHRHRCTVTSISETGAELLFSDQVPPFVDSSRLQWDPTIPSLPVIGSAAAGSRRAVHWGPLDHRQRLALLRWLYGRSGCWRDRKAPPEWRGFLILLKRALLGPPAPGPFQRSLVPLATHGIKAGQR